MFIEFITAYAPELVSYTAIIATAAPIIRARMVSDKKALLRFEDIKDAADRVLSKEIDITATLDQMGRTITKLENDYQEKVKEIDTTLMAFMESDIYGKMLTGLDQLQKLEQKYQAKDDSIARTLVELKTIAKTLQEIKNKGV